MTIVLILYYLLLKDMLKVFNERHQSVGKLMSSECGKSLTENFVSHFSLIVILSLTAC